MNPKNHQLGKIRIIESDGYDPWYNLAYEEYLVQNVNKGEVILYLWQNQDTVVIGRNQNPWQECRCELLEEEGGKLARRLSGGGAVFHDLGNLNFTFVMDKSFYNLDRQLEVILNGVRSLGIEAVFSGRNDLVVDQQKFSGNAFYYTGKAAYHHGTILLDTDFNKLVRYLQVSREKIISKGIDSVRSRVINLKELNPAITIEDMKKALKESFLSIYKENSNIDNMLAQEDNGHCRIVNSYSLKGSNSIKVGQEKISPSRMAYLKELYEKYSSWEWRYGKSPQFDISYSRRFAWGGVEIGFSLQKGIIKEVRIYSDAMDAEVIRALSARFKGIPFRLEELLKSIEITKKRFINSQEGKIDNIELFSDFKEWLKSCDW